MQVLYGFNTSWDLNEFDLKQIEKIWHLLYYTSPNKLNNKSG